MSKTWPDNHRFELWFFVLVDTAIGQYLVQHTVVGLSVPQASHPVEHAQFPMTGGPDVTQHRSWSLFSNMEGLVTCVYQSVVQFSGNVSQQQIHISTVSGHLGLYCMTFYVHW